MFLYHQYIKSLSFNLYTFFHILISILIFNFIHMPASSPALRAPLPDLLPHLLVVGLAAMAATSPPRAAADGMPDGGEFYVQMDLSTQPSAVVLRVNPSWAPLGAARFRDLVAAGFYDDTRMFRVLDGDYGIWVAQFGISGDPETQRKWERPIKDDPVKHSNVRGTLSFAMSGPNSRTTQLFLNYGDCSKVLDSDFAPFAEVVSGMGAVDAIYKTGEGAPSGSGPSQQLINQQGNAYLDEKFPQLTRILKIRIVDKPMEL